MFVSCTVWTVARTNRGTAVLLRSNDSGKSLPLMISPTEAQILLNHINGTGEGENSLYRYVNRLCETGGITLKRVDILPGSKKKPRACLRAGRPGEDDFTQQLPVCDALALAMESGLSLFVEEGLFNRKAVLLNLVEQEKKARRKKLEDKLSRLVEKEEYEEAALIRDKLTELNIQPDSYS